MKILILFLALCVSTPAFGLECYVKGSQTSPEPGAFESRDIIWCFEDGHSWTQAELLFVVHVDNTIINRAADEMGIRPTGFVRMLNSPEFDVSAEPKIGAVKRRFRVDALPTVEKEERNGTTLVDKKGDIVLDTNGSVRTFRVRR